MAGFASPHGASAAVIRRISVGRDLLVVSADIWSEYERLGMRADVRRLFDRRGVTQRGFSSLLSKLRPGVESVSPTGEPPACRDEKDRKYLHCAVRARVDALITADRDMLVLEHVEGIPILDAHAFLATFPSA